MEILLFVRLVILGIALAAVVPSDSEAVTKGSVSYLHGDGYVTGDDTRNVTRFDVMNINQYGLVYGRADILSSDDRNSSVLTRVIGHYGHGVHLAGQMQNQNKVSQTSVGLGYSAFGKDYGYFVDVYKTASSYYGDSAHLFAYGSVTIGERYKVDGFVEVLSPTKGDDVYFAQPSISYRLLDGVWIGIEQQRYFNKNGVKGLDEVVNQFKVKWEF